VRHRICNHLEHGYACSFNSVCALFGCSFRQNISKCRVLIERTMIGRRIDLYSPLIAARVAYAPSTLIALPGMAATLEKYPRRPATGTVTEYHLNANAGSRSISPRLSLPLLPLRRRAGRWLHLDQISMKISSRTGLVLSGNQHAHQYQVRPRSSNSSLPGFPAPDPDRRTEFMHDISARTFNGLAFSMASWRKVREQVRPLPQ
jgi:hypothetical protein